MTVEPDYANVFSLGFFIVLPRADLAPGAVTPLHTIRDAAGKDQREFFPVFVDSESAHSHLAAHNLESTYGVEKLDQTTAVEFVEMVVQSGIQAFIVNPVPNRGFQLLTAEEMRRYVKGPTFMQ